MRILAQFEFYRCRMIGAHDIYRASVELIADFNRHDRLSVRFPAPAGIARKIFLISVILRVFVPSAKRQNADICLHSGKHWRSAIMVAFCRGVAQPGSAPAWGAGGRMFESSRPDQ